MNKQQRSKKWQMSLVILVVLANGLALAGGNTLNYQGVLRDNAGTAVPDGPYSMSFSIYTSEEIGTGTRLWGPEHHAGVAVTQGAFSVILGTTTALNDLFRDQEEAFLEVSVDTGGGLQPFAPRVALCASPYALGADAQRIRYDNTASGLTATDVQSAITELDTRLDAVSVSVQSVFGRTGAVGAQSGDYTASQVTNTPAGDISGTTVQAAIEELDTEKAPSSHTHPGTAITSPVASASTAESMPWSGLTGMPADFADGVDNVDGGAAASVPWGGVTGKPAGFADNVDDVDGGAAASVPWTGITGMPAGFADGTDNDSGGDITSVAAGTGLTGGAMSGDATLNANFAGSGTANTIARSDHNHAGTYANATHVHSGADITTGTVATARLDVGTGSTQVAAGNHTHNTLTGPAGSPANAVYVDSSGNAGIGTTAPGARLEVNGGLKFSGNNYVANQTNGIVYKAPRVYQICDPRSGCPPAATADTNNLFGQDITFDHAVLVYITATLISFGTGRRDLAVYLDYGELQRSIVNTGTTSAEVSATCIWTGMVSAGTHRFSVGVQNFCGTGCTRQWGCGCGHGQLDILVLE